MSDLGTLNDMPIQPTNIGRQFVSCYYNLMNKSPESLCKLYTEDAEFRHDAAGPEQYTISVTGKKAIHDIMLERINSCVRHTCTRVTTVDTIKTIEDGLIVQLLGEISFNDLAFRSFSQSFILVQQTPFKYFVQNDIFRFNECEQDISSHYPESMLPEDQISGCDIENTSFDAYDNVDDEKTIEQMANNDELEECPNLNESIIELQSYNLKNVLLEPRAITKENIMKRVPTPENGSKIDVTNENSKNQSQLFQDKCILTIGNVINPNIEFDDDVSTAPTEERDDNEMDTKEAIVREKKKANLRKRKEKKRFSRAQKMEKPDASTNESSIQSDSPERPAIPVTIEPFKSWANETETSSCGEPESVNKTKPLKESDPMDATTASIEPKPKTFADLVKKEQPGQKDEWQDDWKNEPVDRRSSEAFSRSSKSRSSMNRRGRQDKKSSPQDSYQSNRSSSNGDLLQVFVGQIPHGAIEEEIRSMFGRCGTIKRFRMHSNPRTDRAPLYAFVVYESIQSVQKCLAKRNSFYWPENSKNGQKLNVNGDISLMGDVEHSSPPSSSESVKYKKTVKSIGTDTADLKNFHKNFILAEPKDSTNKRRSSKNNANITDVVSTMKNERNISRTGSTRA